VETDRIAEHYMRTSTQQKVPAHLLIPPIKVNNSQTHSFRSHHLLYLVSYSINMDGHDSSLPGPAAASLPFYPSWRSTLLARTYRSGRGWMLLKIQLEAQLKREVVDDIAGGKIQSGTFRFICLWGIAAVRKQ